MSVAGSVVVGLMLLWPMTAKIFPAKWQYRIGKMAIVFFLIPVSFFAGKRSLLSPQTITQSHYSEPPPMVIPESLRPNGFAGALDTLIEKHFSTTMEKHLSFEVMAATLFIWFVGAIVFALWHFYCYRRFSKQLWADSRPIPEDAEAAASLSSCKAALGIYGEVNTHAEP